MQFAVLMFFAVSGGRAGADDSAGTNSRTYSSKDVERVRARCIEGRRMVCGKILRVLPEGLVIESGYTDLLRPPLTDSWLVPGTASATLTPNLIESREPGSPCVGTVFLTDLPKRRGRKPKQFDYVVLLAYPAGEYTYASVGTVHKTVRRFTGVLDAAMRLQLAAMK